MILIKSGPARAQRTAELKKQLEGVDVTERLGARVPLDTPFVDETGHPAALSDQRARPTLLTFNYSRCPMLCSLQLAGLAKAIKELPLRPSRDFEVATVVLDPAESVAQALRAKQVYVRQAGGGGDVGRGWRVLAGDAPGIAAVADSVGFRYRYDPATREYRHKATLIVLTPDGRVSSYLHGISYAPADLRAAVERAARGEVLTAAAQSGIAGFLLDCFRYDPASRAPVAMLIVRLSGLVVLAGLVAFILLVSRRSPRRRKASP